MKGIITFGYGEGSKRVLALLSGTGMGSCLTLNQPSLGSDTTFSRKSIPIRIGHGKDNFL